MLRMFKVTSPMSVGSWILDRAGAAIRRSAVHALDRPGSRGWPPRRGRPPPLLGLPLATYTGALLANTAVPVWHEARGELPFLFGGRGRRERGRRAAPSLTPARARRPGAAAGRGRRRRPSSRSPT